MREFDSFTHVPIRREDAVMEMLNEHEERMKSQEKAIEEAKSKRSEVIERIRHSCNVFKAMCPDAWSRFAEDVTMIHSIASMLDRRTPLDLMRDQKEFGVYVDAQQWALEKAFIQGQLEILDSMMNLMKIDPDEIRKKADEASRASMAKKSFFQKVLDVFLKSVKR